MSKFWKLNLRIMPGDSSPKKKNHPTLQSSLFWVIILNHQWDIHMRAHTPHFD
jgi:hypothetical protein